MKSLLTILIGGTMVFMALSIGQEWSFFSEAWFGLQQVRTQMKESERQAALDGVRQLLTLMRHFYATGGDPRFSERMPASETVVEEMFDDVEYLARNHRIQVPSLHRLEPTAMEELGDGQVEIRTREFWTIRFLWSIGGEEVEPPRAHIVYGKYLLSRKAHGWQVEGWDMSEPSETETEPQ